MRKLFALLPLLFFVVFSPKVYADTGSMSAQPVTPTMVQHSDYTLAYPGLLPDSPIYGIKVFRDRLVSFFISDPLKKSAFDLLQADKRLGAGFYLARKGGTYDTLVITTISKGENYFDDAIGQLPLIKQQGEDVSGQAARLLSAAQKHEEVLKQLKQSNPSLKVGLDKELGRLSEFEKRVTAFGK